jgi:hypothetical protein
MHLQYTTLCLYAPLWYVSDPALKPFQYSEGEETVMAFELARGAGQSIDPDPADYLGPLLWMGRAIPVRAGTGSDQTGAGVAADTVSAPDRAGAFCIPGGRYFFSQIREPLERDGWTRLAIEVQKEGLWQRKRLGSRLYLRVVYEDGAAAAQILRELGS